MTTSFLNIPTLFSLTRLPLAAIFLCVPDTAVRIATIIGAAASDYLDGWWARSRGPRTRTGALVDPITDKIFVLAALAAFTLDGTLAPAALLVLLARDIFVSIGFLVLIALRSGVRLEARFPGKVVTNLQLAAVLILLLLPALTTPLVIITAAASLWAITDYAIAGLRVLRAPARPG